MGDVSDAQNDANGMMTGSKGFGYAQDQLAPAKPRVYPQDQLMNMNGPVSMPHAEYARLQRIEAAAQKILQQIDESVEADLVVSHEATEALRAALYSPPR